MVALNSFVTFPHSSIAHGAAILFCARAYRYGNPQYPEVFDNREDCTKATEHVLVRMRDTRGDRALTVTDILSRLIDALPKNGGLVRRKVDARVKTELLASVPLQWILLTGRETRTH